MFKFRLESTDEYERLVKFYIENGLEFTDEDLIETDTSIVKSWKITQGNDFLVAALTLAKREGEFIIDGISVEHVLRKCGLGKILVKKAIDTVRELGGNSIFLVARSPEFFRALGFTRVDASDAPNFFECKTCPQFQKNCHPEVMTINV